MFLCIINKVTRGTRTRTNHHHVQSRQGRESWKGDKGRRVGKSQWRMTASLAHDTLVDTIYDETKGSMYVFFISFWIYFCTNYVSRYNTARCQVAPIQKPPTTTSNHDEGQRVGKVPVMDHHGRWLAGPVTDTNLKDTVAR